MTIHRGDLFITTDTTLPDLTTVQGDLYVYKGATLTANALTTVRGNLWVGGGATLIINTLTAVGRSVIVRDGATLTADALTVVGGSLYVREGATLTANALTTAYGVPGRELTRCPVDGYVLWLGDNSLYYAGCVKALTREQALDHWSTDTARAKLFTAAILSS
jgi:hypothetical protein